MRTTMMITPTRVLNKTGRPIVSCLTCGIKVLNKTKTMPVVTMAIL